MKVAYGCILDGDDIGFDVYVRSILGSVLTYVIRSPKLSANTNRAPLAIAA